MRAAEHVLRQVRARGERAAEPATRRRGLSSRMTLRPSVRRQPPPTNPHARVKVRESQPDAAVSRRQRAAAEQRLRTLLDAGAPSMVVLQEDMALGSSVLNQVSARARENRKPQTRAPPALSERVCASLSAIL